MLEKLKELVCELNLELPKNRLTAATSGNISGRDSATGYVVIKPSGVKYSRLKPSLMVVVDMEGRVIEGELKPSVDTETHLYLYRHRQDINGVVHTHSNYATSFAALGEPIPVYLTAIADEFGGPIPIGEYAPIGGEEIGKEILRSLGNSPAILMKNHGVFTVGSTPEAALKAAIMTEDLAKTVHLALLRGKPQEIPPEEVARAHRAYMEKYGQAK
ncbi:MAG: L-ribulose-5-phosphate 4-epimerase [Candidatus Aerophobetes bacterium]|nr:L-ribulose-5-phosphate 4-epimerase [Candidatus Aerophobetes bacterium]